MTENDFEKLIERPEGETLDYKRDIYDFENSKNEPRYDFTKDVVAMANTPREQSAQIVFGVHWTPDTGSKVVGLRHQLDDEVFQAKFLRKEVQPAPRFTYTPLQFKGRQVGVLDIPIGEDGPYLPLTRIGSMPAGGFNYRRGTQNAIAVGSELHRILDWFRTGNIGIPDEQGTNSWRQLFDAIHRFEEGVTYILVVDRISSQTDATIEMLGMPPWRAVIDFDPNSENYGILKHISNTLSPSLTPHRYAIVISVGRSVPYEYSRETPCH